MSVHYVYKMDNYCTVRIRQSTKDKLLRLKNKLTQKYPEEINFLNKNHKTLSMDFLISEACENWEQNLKSIWRK